ncbi:virulence plasmid B protein [Mucilaginibacter frigoritolerans]|uniref:Virulence plasmid B protein n=1 Tax=Mucilaginibacter frigoritolerans TaxID=652788 RepID=A0A562TM07_9SPHI|nr:SpvB/TcaC N-terminal domain-containing protein [Mucilaginibacter frigoritolerans]TWI94532.1 virulence plasmid B protein [Mucilaginibacter frigoritolerans]
MKKALLTLVSLLIIVQFPFSAFAQVDPSLESLRNYVPPSPNASSLGRYAEWPVSLYTGLPNISIPIYQLKGRSLTVPIDISYHAAGNRVGDVASNVGLGWSLNAGGVITRTVRGLPDEFSYFAYASFYTNQNDFTSATTPSDYYQKHQADVANLNGDSEQDIYTINAMGRSYRLLLKADGSVSTMPASNIQVYYSSPNYWTVILEDGTRLLFGNGNNFTETNTITYGNTVGGLQFPTAWYLNTITSPVGEKVNFTYSYSNLITQDTHITQSDWTQYKTGDNYGNTTESCGLLSNGGMATHLQNQQLFMLSVATIESDLTKVTFIPSTTGRLDLNGAFALSEIQVFSKLLNKQIDDYLFNYTYTQAAAMPGNELPGPTSDTSYVHQRLKLMSLKRQALNNSAYMLWSFQYNPLHLPSRRSYAQDHMGFYNGAISNTSFLPPLYFALPQSNYWPASFQYNSGFTPSNNHDPGAVKGFNGKYMQAEMLTQITYPTGGYTQFNYEPNSIPVSAEQFTTGVANIVLNVTPSQPISTQSSTFTITKPQYVMLNFSSIISATVVADQSSVLTYAVILDSSGNTVAQFTLGPVAENGSSGGYNGNASSYFNLLAAGTYTLKVWTNASATDFSNTPDYVDMNAYLTYSQSLGQQSFNQMVGGLRVKSILNYDGVNPQPINDRYFNYSEGFVINPVDSLNDYMTTQQSIIKNIWTDPELEVTYTQFCQFTKVTRNSSTKYSLGSIQGGVIGYGAVTTLYGPNGENGKTISQFSNAPDIGTSTAKLFPYPPTDPREWRRGLLLYQTDFNAIQKVKMSSNTYSFNPVTNVTNFAAGFATIYTNGSGSDGTSACQNQYGWCGITAIPFNISSEQVLHNSSTETTYNTLGTDSVSTTTNFYYDDAANMQPVRTVSINSKGDTVINYNRTALEEAAINSSIPLSANAVTAIDTMLARNMVGVPVESEKYVRGLLTDKMLINYQLINNFVLPQEIKSQAASNPIQSRLLLNNYDTYGNLLDQQKTTGPVNDYIWDYVSSYPIASVVNGGQADIAYTSFESNGTGNWTIPSTVRDSITAALTGYKSYNLSNGAISRPGLTAATTYIISYWTLNTSPYSITGTISGYPIQGATINGWTYYEHRVTGITSVTLSGSGNIDELRLYPVNAQMTTYTYDPLVGATSMTDAKNETTYYEYDGLLRLRNIKDQYGNIIKSYCYNYAGQAYGCNIGGINSAPPYVQMTVTSAGTTTDIDGNTQANNIYTFKSFSDAAGTIPYTLSTAITVNYQINTTTTYDASGEVIPTSTPMTITIPAGANQSSTNSIMVNGCTGTSAKGSCSTSTVVLSTGMAYLLLSNSND